LHEVIFSPLAKLQLHTGREEKGCKTYSYTTSPPGNKAAAAAAVAAEAKTLAVLSIGLGNPVTKHSGDDKLCRSHCRLTIN